MAAKPVRNLPEPELMVTRFKSSQQKIQLRKMDRSMKQMTQLLKSPSRSPRKKPDKTGKDQLKPDTSGVKLDTTGAKLDTTGVKEFHLDKDKKNLDVKKVVLKPKYSSEVVARTNKRKMGTPRKGKKTSSSPTNKSIKLDTEMMTDNSELSMTDAVRLMEVTKRLTDEDLMEILTCPSPVWWEDPPDEGYIEESICNISEFRTAFNAHKQDLVKDSLKSKETSNINVVDFEKEIKMFKVKSKKTDSKLEGKKSKLESIVGNIKKKAVTSAVDADEKVAEGALGKQVKNRRFSSSTEDMYSDISLNEEEILKDLENIEIPIADGKAEKEEVPRIKVRSDLVKCKDVNNVPKTLPPLKRKPNFKAQIKSPDIVKLGTNIKKDDDSISGSNIRFISDDDSQNSDVSNLGLDTKSKNDVDENGDDFKNISNGLISDLAEYITVYKIMSNDSTADGNTRRPVKKGKLHHFFKKYKNNKRFKKNNSVNINDLTENNNKVNNDKHVNKVQPDVVREQIRAKGCDFCLIQADTGVKEISCERCQIEDNSCELCNFNKDEKRCTNANSISSSCNYSINNT